MKISHQRNLIRWIHLIGATAIGIYVYAPWRNNTWFILLMQFLVIPSLSLTGLWLWKGHWLRRKTITPARSTQFFNA